MLVVPSPPGDTLRDVRLTDHTTLVFLIVIGSLIVALGWCWWRRHRRHETPVDTSALDALTRRANTVTKGYEKLIPTTEKEASMTSSENPAQADIDADVQQLTADITTLASVQSQIADLVTAAQQANTPVDTSALDALVQTAAPVVANYQSLIPPAPSDGN